MWRHAGNAPDCLYDQVGGYELCALEGTLCPLVLWAPHEIMVVEVISGVVPASMARVPADDPVGSLEFAHRKREP